MSRPLVDIRLEGVSAAAQPGPALHDVSFHVRYGEFFTVLGPPHSGKSAVLRAIAGFLPLSAGRIVVDGEDISRLPPRRRGLGYVFHQGALWPHVAVEDQVAFGLEQQGLGRGAIEERLRLVLRRLRLEEVRRARPADLTLDQQRRLALARALAIEPRVLLLDEPLAHLDPVSRKTLRLELAKLHIDLAVTTICATRDAADALALSNRLAIVQDGRVIQTGEPEELYQRPLTPAAAEALGPATFLPVRVVEVRDLGVVVETEHGDRVPVAGIGQFGVGDAGVLVLRPETMAITEAAEAYGPGIPGRVAVRVFEGARYLYEVDVGCSAPIRVELPAGRDTGVFRLGDRVRVAMSSETMVLLPGAPTSGAGARISE
ncbi:MAG: ABC transporter ATP-binding protein [Candidatus Rokubacteria bacterium]|nr:ABC transporter ATP-binding protein [Candidatus Rokubacteria bacterium]MBI3826161.1 ABC transporter ATP-binding protein [Candidatus Rokubacteria bacterium]